MSTTLENKWASAIDARLCRKIAQLSLTKKMPAEMKSRIRAALQAQVVKGRDGLRIRV